MKLKLFFALFAAVGAQTSVAQTIPLRIGFIPVLGTSQIFVADQLGMLKAAGLTPRFTNFESGPVMIQALASGTLDVYVARRRAARRRPLQGRRGQGRHRHRD